MSGTYNGLQTRIKQLNPLATFVPCAGHSLQLVGSVAAESSDESIAFFGIRTTAIHFFSSCTRRWEILLSKFKTDSASPVLKTLSKPRLSARADASKALHKSYHEIVSALTEIGSYEGQTKDVIVEKLKNLETVIMICFWNCILMKFNAVREN
jgi:hypothetical protein